MTTTVTTNPTFTVRARGQLITFTSAFATNGEAWHFLNSCVEQKLGSFSQRDSEFAAAILLAARERRLSTLQLAWLHKLATDERKLTPPAAPVVADLNLLPVVEMLARAAAAQKRRPRISLQTGCGQKVVLTLAGERSKNPGTVLIADGRPYGSNTYFGRILADGAVATGRSWTPEVEALLVALAKNPAHVAQQHGVATSECCFCRLPLSTAESRTAGYGPICADKFGLPWGDTGAADAADAAAKAPLVEATVAAPAGPSTAALELLRDLAVDAPNWNGTVLWHGADDQVELLQQLAVLGLVTTVLDDDAGRRDLATGKTLPPCLWVTLTDAGQRLAARRGGAS